MAGAVSRTIVSPLERLKILLQIQSVGREEYRLSIWKALVKMGREEGWRGFMRGNGTNCIRIIPYSAVQFGSYNFYKKVSILHYTFQLGPVLFEEFLEILILVTQKENFLSFFFLFFGFHKELILRQFAEPSPGAELTPIRRLICGGFAGITSVTITYPLDIVRTRLSIQSASFAALGNRAPEEKLPGMFQTMVVMYKSEGGLLALYRGIVPTVAGVAPYVGRQDDTIVYFCS
jgi:solute carrier family 25 phosphate transporter 23/24/25/41